jgi:hypothetical protein
MQRRIPQPPCSCVQMRCGFGGAGNDAFARADYQHAASKTFLKQTRQV